MEQYFRSIERPFEDTLASKRKDESNALQKLTVVLGFGIALSVLPGIPALLDLTIPRLTGVRNLSLFHLTIPLDLFKFWWPASVVAFILLEWAAVSLSNSRSRNRKKTWLRDEQIRFALCWKISHNLRSYERNRLPIFVENAQTNWQELFPYLRRLFNPLAGPFGDATYISALEISNRHADGFRHMEQDTDAEPHPFSRMFPQIKPLLRLHAWFKLTSETEVVVNGLDGMSSKLGRRLSNKQDLARVADCLDALSGYLYSLTYGSADTRLSEWGVDQLSAFAQAVNELPSLESGTRETASAAAVTKTARAQARLIGRIFAHENLLICFVAWYGLFELLVILGLVIAFKLVPALKMDSVIVTSLIATPLLGAAAIVAVSKARSG